MRIALTIYTFLIALTLLSCDRAVEPQSVAGYVIDTRNSNQIVLHVPDSIPAERSYAINDNTLFGGGGIVEGNVAEVIYLPTEDGSQPIAQSVTADVTYPRIIGRWTTDKDDALQIDLLLQPHGVVKQQLPTETLLFDCWQLTGEENQITLHGTLSLPPQRVARDKSKELTADGEQELQIAPSRREMRFSVTAQLAYDEEGNTEQHKVLIITTDDGRTSRLYPTE